MWRWFTTAWRAVVKGWHWFRRWLDRLSLVPGQWKDEVAALRGTYPDRESLQSILDGNSAEANVYDAAASRNLEDKKVIAFLGASLKQSAEPLVQAWLSRHSADLLAVAGIATLAMLPLVGARVDAHKKAARDAEAARRDKAPHAIATHDLPPYGTLEPADIEVKNTPSEEAARALRATLVGRYSTKLIAAGQTVNPDVLSSKKIDLGSFAILRLTLKLKPALEGRTLPSPASLLFSSRGTPAQGEAFSVVLLNLDADGITATVAVPQARMSEATKWIGNSDAHMGFSAR
jgi:hypothetical protein